MGSFGYYGKREADAEAEAKPYYPYGVRHLTYGGYLGHHGLGYSFGGYYGKREADAEAKPYYPYGVGHVTYGGYLGHHGLGYSLGYYGKREAEAEPYYPYNFGYTGYGGFLDTMVLVTLESTMVKKMHTTLSPETGNQDTCGTHKYGICKLKQSSK